MNCHTGLRNNRQLPGVSNSHSCPVQHSPRNPFQLTIRNISHELTTDSHPHALILSRMASAPLSNPPMSAALLEIRVDYDFDFFFFFAFGFGFFPAFCGPSVKTRSQPLTNFFEVPV